MPIQDLPTELIHQCLQNADYPSLGNAALVCRAWLAPSRDISWRRISLDFEGEVPGQLCSILRNKGTCKPTIPRHVGSLLIDEGYLYDTNQLTDEDKADIARWEDGLMLVLDYFEHIGMLTIGNLNLQRLNPELRGKLLSRNNGGIVFDRLVVQNLILPDITEVAPFILDNPHLTFLGLGVIKIDNVGSGEDGENAQIESAPLSTAVFLPKLRHLVVFADGTGAWSHILPHMHTSPSSLQSLCTLIAVCQQPDLLSELIQDVSATLKSLAVGINAPGVRFDISNCSKLKNLSVNISQYPTQEPTLADLMETLSTAPPTLSHLYINCGPSTCTLSAHPPTGASLWGSLDEHLCTLKGLNKIAFTQVISSSMAMFMHAGPDALGGVFGKWKADLQAFGEEILPRCKEKRLVGVEQLTGSWTSNPFAGTDLE
ncbi:uncharacterized protein B0I36DRAFT_331092 [Microdochium trichocladiopsis]|uniref:F-box domain-containing protein n=1 Tax=Microdochium trichocladiopsis TaxID=1682393 RepID=A0A9P9BMV4_9PEZI|nr:uncharacterized protein B0I36DRAFT_331092 [Microdochium trichocladiopsis]KAH7026653.1 hypothetical protein B0I36DRAFT_331092 [Microdochium trichocladiopsis]